MLLYYKLTFCYRYIFTQLMLQRLLTFCDLSAAFIWWQHLYEGGIYFKLIKNLFLAKTSTMYGKSIEKALKYTHFEMKKKMV